MRSTFQRIVTAQRPRVRRGFTLAELVVSMTILTILMGAMTSVIVLASHALPTSESSAQSKLAILDVMDQIDRELFYATSFTEATANAVSFTVADRGHGPGGPETIRYAWSGIENDPLTRQYNGGTVVTLFDKVRLFNLVYEKRAGLLEGLPSVLLMVQNDIVPSAQDLAKKVMMESWGFTVTLLSATRALVDQKAALQTPNVVYLAQGVLTVPAFLSLDPHIGIVCEEPSLLLGVGISKSSLSVSANSVDILDNAHEITKPYALGPLQVFSTNELAFYALPPIAPGGRHLAAAGLTSNYALIAVELDRKLINGVWAPARRVSLPWGDKTFDFNNLTADGLTLMRRAITWAAAPIEVAGVSISLQPKGGGSRTETRVQLLNTPEMP